MVRYEDFLKVGQHCLNFTVNWLAQFRISVIQVELTKGKTPLL